MPKSKIPAHVIEALNRQLNHELSAAQGYRALSAWCADQNLIGFASYFAKQVNEEHDHAGKISAHMIDRNVVPVLAALAAPRQNFKSLLEVAQHAQEMEHTNTEGINSVYEAALAAKDYASQVFMQWFINEQVEEEAWCIEMVERIQAANCAGGLSDLDRHIERYLSRETPAA